MIHLVVFIPRTAGDKGERLEAAIRNFFNEFTPLICRSITALTLHLQTPAARPQDEIYVLLADTAAGLKGIGRIRDHIDDKRLVLVLHDHSERTHSAAHQLRPRFIGYADGSYEDLCAVLAKMIARTEMANRGNR